MNPAANALHDDRFNRWQAEHRGIFLKIARAFAANSVDQADLVQEMLLQVWLSLGSFREQAKPSTWIYRVCLNTALTWRRDENRHLTRVRSMAQPPDPPSAEPRPGTVQEEAELLDRLYAAIRELSPADRSLVLLSLEGLSYRDISEVTGLTENHVGVTLTRARGKLAERLKGVRHELE